MRTKIVKLFVLFLCHTAVLSAQDLHFSRYQALEPMMNPALTGFIPKEADIRLSTIYRNQWQRALGNATYETVGFAFDMRNCLFKTNSRGSKNNKFKDPSWGLGLSFVHDESGIESVRGLLPQKASLNRDQVNLSASVILPVEDKIFFTGGLRVGGIFNRLKTSDLSYDEQFDGEASFDPTVPGEFDALDQLNTNMMNVGAGLSMFVLQRNWGANVGFALDHIFFPVEYKFLESSVLPRLSRKITMHGKLSYFFKQKNRRAYGVNLSGVVMLQNPHQQLTSTMDFFFQNKEDFTLTVGGGLRATTNYERQAKVDAILTNLTIGFGSIIIGFNYDINVSNFRRVSNGYGALECSIAYRWKKRSTSCSPILGGCETNGKNTHPLFF
ncbi:MAG: PorP/SprF family type IX secretion system membrane protein [Saprospiraceae bacterium]